MRDGRGSTAASPTGQGRVRSATGADAATTFPLHLLNPNLHAASVSDNGSAARARRFRTQPDSPASETR
jgi:hypothetical protein